MANAMRTVEYVLIALMAYQVVAAGQGSPSTATAPEIAEGLSTLLSRSPAGNGADQVGCEAVE